MQSFSWHLRGEQWVDDPQDEHGIIEFSRTRKALFRANETFYLPNKPLPLMHHFAILKFLPTKSSAPIFLKQLPDGKTEFRSLNDSVDKDIT